jgi:N-acetylneuraminic acid mutarotase
MMIRRRQTLAYGAAALMASQWPLARAQSDHNQHGGGYERLKEPGAIARPPLADQQAVVDSPAPKASNPGRWIQRAALPLPRSEMAWATVLADRMHLVGGYGEQRVDRAYHHVYDPQNDRWLNAKPLPLGANHVGVTVLDGKLYAIGGFTEQNRKPHQQCFVYDPGQDDWRTLAPLPQACGSVACVALDGVLHGIGGAVGDSFASKRSINTHWVYEPQTDRWSARAPLPTARDHVAALPHAGLIHVIGGRVDSFLTNSNLHHVYDPKKDAWTMRNPLPTARSGHGAAIVDGRIFVMGGEGSNRVFGQNEAYDIKADSWQQYAPMITPRHGLGAVAIGRTIYVAGGGAVMGGGIQTSIHEAFTLDA